MGKRKEKAGFDEFYRSVFGERWTTLRKALEEDAPIEEFTEGLVRPYLLDPASVRAARALGVEPSDRVLDLCAAPGGKSLVLASLLGLEGTLVANEKSGERRERLRRVLRDHLAETALERVRVTGHDAARWCLHETDAYDRILLDVPCSSERHLLHSPSHLAKWSPARTRNLAIQQFAILSSALRVVRPGGYLLYSTCALSPAENDGVVGRLLARHPETVELAPTGDPNANGGDTHDPVGSEPTEFGRMILPDRAGGSGPMYFAKLRRIR